MTWKWNSRKAKEKKRESSSLMYIKMGYLVPSAFSKPFAASLSCGGFEVLSSLKWRRIQESRAAAAAAEESISSSLEPTQTFCSSFVSSPSTTSTSKMLTRRSKFHFSFLFVERFFGGFLLVSKFKSPGEQKWFNISRNCIDSSSSSSLKGNIKLSVTRQLVHGAQQFLLPLKSRNLPCGN